jgi:GT2 family glycosyltransferase
MALQCSVIIPAYNRVDLTAQCLQALVANSPGIAYEVIIVDNASSDATPELCASLGGQCTVIRNEENLGFAKACNQGAAVANSDRLLFLNTDTEPFPNWIPPLLSTFDNEPDVGAVGCKLLFPDGTVQHGGVVLVERSGYPTIGAQHLPYHVPADDPLANMRRDVSVTTAACVMIRSEAFQDVGGFDEGYWNGYEDVDLCLALGAKGWRIVYEPGSVLMHHESASGAERFTKWEANVERLETRWAGKVTPDFIVGDDGEARPHPAGIHARAMSGAAGS